VLELEIHLDELSLGGRVIDEVGKPVPSARVSVWHSATGGSRSARVDANGGFQLEGLSPGEVRLLAWADEVGRSEPFRVELSTGATPPEPTLVLRQQRLIRGRLLDATGHPVSSAQVRAAFGGLTPGIARGGTGLDGAFELTAAPDAERLNLQVQAAGQPLWTGCRTLPTDPDDLWLVVLPPGPGGTLSLIGSPPPEALPPPVEPQLETFLVTREGGALTLTDLFSWRYQASGRVAPDLGTDEVTVLSFPQIAPGDYAVVKSARGLWQTAADLCTQGPPPDLAWITVPSAGEALLDLAR
jgi:hypothetical protein